MNRSEKKVKRKKISAVDIVIAVIFLVALISMIYLMVTLFNEENDNASEEEIAADCRLEIGQVDVQRFGITLNELTGSVECDFLKAGDQVYDPITGEAVGRITAVTYRNTTLPSGEVDEEGNLVSVEYPGHIDLIVTVRTELASEQNRTVGSQQLQLGNEIILRTASYEATAEVVGMEAGVN